ncbi:MAG: TIGR02217 family protein [Hyphomicrobiaceae bacterium]
MAFHDVLFPTAISRGSQGGPERKTEVIVLGSGHEERNSRWADSRRSYDAGYGVKSLDDINAVIAFFEERRGRLHGFRWRDHADCKSCLPNAEPSALDQPIGIGDGVNAAFQLAKAYGSVHAPWARAITKPVVGSVVVAVAGAVQSVVQFSVDHLTGILTFEAGHIPAGGTQITAGYLFDVPARFDSDKLEINLSGFSHGAIPRIPIVEVRE